MSEQKWPRAIFHVDMDAFFAAIEVRDDPSLAGLPLIVGGGGARGVVATSSYEARKFGVFSAMPMFQARKRCPQAIVRPPRMSVYAGVSRRVMQIFEDYSPVVEPVSLDEAWIDMSGTESLLGAPEGIARRLQRDVFEAVRLTCSIGVATSRFVSKIASDMNKPNGVTVCPPGGEAAFLAPLPLERIAGVGPGAAGALHALNLKTIGDIAAYPEEVLVARLGDQGRRLAGLSRGEDPRPIVRSRTRRSLGAETTLSANISGADEVRRALRPLVEDIARGLRSKGLRAGGVTLKVKFADFKLMTRAMKPAAPVDDSAALFVALDALIGRADLRHPIRLVGASATDLRAADEPVQGSLLAAPTAKNEKLERALDAVEQRFGRDSIRRGPQPGYRRTGPGGADVE